MKRIIYIVPYFGHLPDFTELWLRSCGKNDTVNWLLVTDDKRKLEYPKIVICIYMTFEKLKERIQSLYKFDINLSTPYKLCDYKVAYGEIVEKEIRGGYDFWGYCDMDLLFGNIRNFLTDELLSEYDVSGFLGHSMQFRNTDEMRKIYRTPLQGENVYQKVFSTDVNCYFDEDALQKILKFREVKQYKEIIFADVSPLYWNFRIGRQDAIGVEKNRHRIFLWRNGNLFSYALQNGKVAVDEYMYIHFLRRKMNFESNLRNEWMIVPNKIVQLNEEITPKLIIDNSRKNMICYWIDFVARKWKKITPKRVIDYIKNRMAADRKGF